MSQEILTPQKNSETINMLWDATFGKIYGGWKDFPKYMQTVFVNTLDRSQIFSDMGNDGPTKKQAGRIIRYRDRVLPGNTIIPGKSAMYLDGVRYDFYNELDTRYVMKDGVNHPSTNFRPITLEKGMLMVNPQAQPEKCKFLMLSMYNEDSPVYWDRDKQRKAKVDIAHPYPQSKPKFYFFDQHEEDAKMMDFEIEVGNMIAKIAMLSADEMEALAEKLGIVVPETSADPLTHIRFNLQQRAKTNPERVKDAMGRMVSTHTAIHTAVKSGIFYVEDRKWYCKGTDAEGNLTQKQVWEEPMNPDLTETEKIEMLASHLEETDPALYNHFAKGARERLAKRSDVGKATGKKPGRPKVKAF